ncbi:MAG: NnrU family protein [Geminicoccaceae bacterium]|nr:NnrU family protein [Geminicoccaceae bacterium]
MSNLLVAAIFFVGTHLGISSTQLRSQLIDRIGDTLYRILYSAIALVALIWMIDAYAEAPYQPLWYGGGFWRFVPTLVMPFALILLVTGLSGPNPTALGQAPDPDASEPARGMLRVTRHPVMWGIGLWALAHLLANPDLASFILFGAMAVLAFGGAFALDQRRTRENPPGWGVFVQRTSFVPFGAIVEGRQRFVAREIGWIKLAVALALYVVLFVAHPYLFGVPVAG